MTEVWRNTVVVLGSVFALVAGVMVLLLLGSLFPEGPDRQQQCIEAGGSWFQYGPDEYQCVQQQ
jgi:hypothetical protein